MPSPHAGRWNLRIGGTGRTVPGYVNLDLVAVAGVDVAADAERLPFASDVFQRVECDAVLEHVRDPARVMQEIHRVLAPGGYVHPVTPFCHPFHECPADCRRFTLDGLKQLAGPMEIVAEGWRTGPTATLLAIAIEYVKLLLRFRAWRAVAHVVSGWLLFPLRYADLLLRSPAAHRIGNHCYVWLRKTERATDSVRNAGHRRCRSFDRLSVRVDCRGPPPDHIGGPGVARQTDVTGTSRE